MDSMFVRKLKRRLHRMKRRIKKKIYLFLVSVYEGDYRISLFSVFCTLLALVLLVGCFLPSSSHPEELSASFVFGSELTHAMDYADSRVASIPNAGGRLHADVTLLFLPKDNSELVSFLSAPLYGFYLTGRELRYLPEYYASLSDSFSGMDPFIGGLSYTYNPNRIIYNRATDVALYSANGAVTPIEDNRLYYVIGNELCFSMFQTLSKQTFHLIDICPKNAAGIAVSDLSGQLLYVPSAPNAISANASHASADISAVSYSRSDSPVLVQTTPQLQTLYSIYTDYLRSEASQTVTGLTTRVYKSTSHNTLRLFCGCNIAGFFVLGNCILLLILANILRPYLYRAYIMLRVYKAHRRKRAKFSARNCLYGIRKTRRSFFKKFLTNHAA